MITDKQVAAAALVLCRDWHRIAEGEKLGDQERLVARAALEAAEAAEQRLCRTCRFYRLTNLDYWHPSYEHLHCCDRWREGYNWAAAEIAPNEVVVESDEGWAALMGPEFGCVLWEPTPPEGEVNSPTLR